GPLAQINQAAAHAAEGKLSFAAQHNLPAGGTAQAAGARAHKLKHRSLSGHSSHKLKEPNNRFDAPIKIGDVELLIGRMQVVVRQTEVHHDAGNLQVPLKDGDDGQ